jgi:L-fuculose-phosphate aldolase
MKFQATRMEVVDACRALADKGFLAGTGGNVALRADESHFAVTPSATDYYTMSAIDVCIVRLSDLKRVAGKHGPSVESGLHARMLRARRDCNASIHTHQPIASAYALFGESLTDISVKHRLALGASVPCAGYAPSGTSWLAWKVSRIVRPDVHAYLMQSHGVVCVGANLQVAMHRVAVLEHACANYFKRQFAGQTESFPAGFIDAVSDALAQHATNNGPGAAL